MSEIELVIFDMAGTTINDDDSVNRCVRAALENVGVTVTPAEVNRVMGIPKPAGKKGEMGVECMALGFGERASLIERKIN